MKRLMIFGGFVSMFLISGCALNSQGAEDDGSIKLILNWFPKSQMGGYYAADTEGYYEENGLEVDIQPGGPEVSAIQQVVAGDGDFGLAHADQLLLARNEGMELVAIAATMQNSPQVLMTHEGHGLENFEDLNGRTAYIESVIPYWEYLTNHYQLDEVNEVSYSGQYVNFVTEMEAVSQAYETSEPYWMEKEGINTETLLLSESGYNPYNVVMFTTKEYLEKNEEVVANFVDAFTEGWTYYRNNYQDVNEVIMEANGEIALDDLEFEAETQEPFIFGGDAETYGFGYMDESRWETLIEQLYSLELIDEPVQSSEVFTNEFLPE